MFSLGVILVALGVLFSLTALALRSTDQLLHPYVAAVILAATLAFGLILIVD
jgi:hypothetical protein